MANLLQLAGYVQQQGERGRQLGQAQRLGSLASQTYTAPQEQHNSLLGEMAKISPEFAQQQQTQMQDQGDRRRRRLAGAAKYLLSAFERGDQAAIQGAYRTVRPEFEAMANGKQLPDQVDDTILPMLHQVIAAAGGEQMGAGTPAQLQTFRAMTQGMTPEEIEKARRIQLGLEGRASSAGMQTISVMGADGRKRQFTFDPGVGSYVEATLGGATPQVLPEGGGQQAVDAVTSAATVMARAGVPAEQIEAWINSQPGFGTMQPAAPQPSGASPFVSPTEAQQAGAVEAAEQAAQLAALPQREAIQTQAALERARGEAQIAANTPSASQRFEMQQKQQKERKLLDATTADLQSTIQIIDQILADREDFGGVTGMGRIGAMIPGTDWADLDAKMETLRARSAFGTLQEMRANSPTGGALGSVTERELGLLQSAETQLANKQSPEALEQALRNYKQSLQESIRRMHSGLQEFYGQGAAPPGGSQSAAVTRARNPQTGEVIEFRNGQWVPAR